MKKLAPCLLITILQIKERLMILRITPFCLAMFASVGFGSPDTDGPGFEEIEITGLFSVGGKPMVSLSIGNSSSFMLKPGQRSRGIKLLQVKGDNDPYVVLERNGLKGRVFLNKSGPSRTREVRTGDLRLRGGLYYARGDKEPFNGKQITPRSDGSKGLEMP